MDLTKLRYHHLGIPTKEKHEGEVYLEKFKMYVAGYDTSPYKIEWMRYEDDSPVNKLVQSVPHIAFEVDDLEKAIEGKEVIISPNSPSEGITVAFIVDNGAPVEFLQIKKTANAEK
ncbi:MAG: hypothetical protein Q8L04_03960 [Ignavibacteria bacterium]|nr:hypothetical protein [Ignavibacteria bacterium]